MMVPIPRGAFRSGMRSGLSGRTPFIAMVPDSSLSLLLVAARARQVQTRQAKPPRSPDRRRRQSNAKRSAVAQAVGGAFPLRHIVGDHARGLHGGLAELGVAGNLALDPLALGMQEVAQAFQFANQVFDLAERGP